MNWVHALNRLQNANPQATLAPLVASLKPGQQLLFVRPLTEGAELGGAVDAAGATALGAMGRAAAGDRICAWWPSPPTTTEARAASQTAPSSTRRSPELRMTEPHSDTALRQRRHHAGASGRRARRRPGGADRRLPARQAGQAGDRARVHRPGRRDRAHRGSRRLPLRPRRPPLLHEGQGGRRPLARDHEGGVPQAPAPVADLLERQVPRVPAPGHGRDQEARPGRAHRRSSPICGRRSSPRAARTRSSSGSPTASASGCTTTSSRPTPRSCGASRRPRSAPSGPPSESRACRSSAPPSPRSSATRATRSSR